MMPMGRPSSNIAQSLKASNLGFDSFAVLCELRVAAPGFEFAAEVGKSGGGIRHRARPEQRRPSSIPELDAGQCNCHLREF
jgi:hypothetical protein